MGDDGHVYCVSDYAKKFGDVCKVCDTPILPSETTVKGGEFAYHVEHFVCFHCKLSLVNQSFIQKYDNIYCLADFYNIIADKCEKCNTPVQDSDFIDAMGSSWHVECFVCHRCKASPDCAEGMYEHDGAPYCHKCYKDIRTEVYEKTGVELP
ncbi:hypothetical protein SARC_04169 [Sphaeroforma arctica JP610]|uniref:LIM zinc-binding domain-containing protein n=1 Tax=Sphaeroforma arctica JP610 TaxID=667725 RepID=A0A0L0G3G2_9EUKA|nr:hypothetical protein SARC_04169 [Sphaeroforma arctica JP610]KNC83585.1 hypothetical protein SARC_04169 [Sphaeroforma arctica JP610]|eukprot:XP_014157487.1 hypothetical protein SARC_04169 [Sphaeroforma arctica JP610]